MAYRFVLHRQASKQLSKLPSDVDSRIRDKLRDMVSNEYRDLVDFDVTQISGLEHTVYRTRIGGYRVCFLIDAETIAILHVDDREGADGNTAVLDERADDFR